MSRSASGTTTVPEESTVEVGAHGGDAELDDPARVGTGGTLGRYVILEAVGRGGMGRVLRAYDPKLEREVALKVVRTEIVDPTAHARMLREARAMAQLSQANVVAVYDVEETAAGIMLVMEYVAGTTLRAWIRDAGADWRTVVAHFVRAGQGLAAAHAVGLLHRDFKPTNVLVTASGEVKVTDFGLAKSSSTPSQVRQSVHVPDPPSRDSNDDLITRADIVLGTPRYMAPEQYRGETLTAAVDQYAFCVALWEALAGRAPFAGRSFAEMKADKEGGAPAWPAEGPAVPRTVVRAIRRGLAAQPDARWPDMDALLAALTHAPPGKRRWQLAAGGVAITAAIAASLTQSRIAEPPCSGAQAHLTGVWDDARREEVHAAILGVGTRYAETTWSRTAAALDRQAERWTAMHTEACEATAVRAEQSAEVLDLRMGCLLRAKTELQSVVGVLANADADVLLRAHKVVGSLSSLARCADVAALLADVDPPTPQDQQPVQDLRWRLAQAKAARHAGRADDAHKVLVAAKEALAHVAYEPIATELDLEHGAVLSDMGDYAAAETQLRAALARATRLRQWPAVQEAAVRLMFLVGERLRRADEGLRYLELAQGLAAGDPSLEPGVLIAYAAVLNSQGKHDEAVAQLQRAIALRENASEPNNPDLVASRTGLAIALRAQGKFAEAEAELRAVLELQVATLGPNHPDVVVARSNVANALASQGRYQEAEVEHRWVLEARERLFGPEHPDVATALNNLGAMLNARGRFAEAEAAHRRALAIREKVFGADHSTVATTRINVATDLYAQGKHADAEVEYRRALAVLKEALPLEHPSLAMAHNNLAGSLQAMGRWAEAEAEQRQALASQEAALGAEHPDVAMSLTNLASIVLAQGRAAEAEPLAARGSALQQSNDVPLEHRASAAFVLGRVRWETASDAVDRARARGWVAEATALYGEAGPAQAAAATEAQAWLQQHAGR